MPDDLPGTKVIFDEEHLRTTGKLRFKNLNLNRYSFCDKLQGIKIVMVLAHYAL